jgi:exonuclease III
VQAAKKVSFGLRIVTANTSSWSTAQLFLAQTTAHVVCVQEHKLHGQEKIDEAYAWAAKLGWTSIWSQAVMTEKDGYSGGVAIFARNGVGLRQQDIDTSTSHRVVAGILEAPSIPVMDIVSVYFKSVTGMSGEKADLMAELAHFGSQSARPGVIAGDFNASPEAVASTGITDQIYGRLLQPANNIATCTAGKYTLLLTTSSSTVAFRQEWTQHGYYVGQLLKPTGRWKFSSSTS